MNTLQRGLQIGTMLLLVGATPPLPAQSGVKPPDAITAAYHGFITWKNSSTDADGTATETVIATVTKGKVDCAVDWVSPSHSAHTNGPGILEISLGLSGNASSKGKLYSFRVACPDAEYSDGIRKADLSRGMESFEQPGGEVVFDLQTQKWTLPDPLKGTLTDKFNAGGGSSMSTMTWFFCRGCTPPPPPPFPPPPPPPPPLLGGTR